LDLRTVVRDQGNNAALKDGSVTPEGHSFAFEEVPVLIDAFRRMVRGLEWDVCEMAFATYLCAREHGVAFTAIPAFVMRGFHHGTVVHNPSAGLRSPKDLEGDRVGVNRGYTVTTGVWARGVLQDEHGVDLSRVTWVLSGDEHVADYVPPKNVIPLDAGADLGELVASGEIPAVIALPVGDRVDGPALVPLIPDPDEAAFGALRDRGHYPINHLLVVRDDVLRNHPGVAVAIFDAFAEAKRRYLDALRNGRIAEPSAVDRLYGRVMDIQPDPLPYGVEPNRAMIEEMIRHALAQEVIRRPVRAEDLFARESLDLMA
jgi:4,5-dihydroxyphthalate decarboxylase